ncbi:bifunctional MaoC family dehydratase N-terminal/OB-fold nucleic acid binding domain-containing protein [Streptomyces pacificus]|uniref:bifunctional MaoC family dehydratase N-terminal/OB-fold nucleic acid binding domain-containing protein n=1 Tax=Streptomyces pacificus TaxID=2705029 RepID=UPI0020B13CB2|nr:OB-fold domain-containing protein [Streptomyces pacificus]
MTEDELYPLLKAYEGRSATAPGIGKDPVNEPMIRHWCEAMGDRNPAYEGPDAIAPPTMLQAWTMGGLSGHTGRTGAHDKLFALLDGAGFAAVVATDCEQEYLRPLRPGQRIDFDSVIETVSPRKRTKLGAGYFITTRMEVRADGELAGTHCFRILKYAPAARSKTRPRRPRPVVNRDNAGFWAGVAEHRLLFQRCASCGKSRFPWLPGCGGCGSAEWDAVEAGGAGTVYSYVVIHHPRFPAFSGPGADGSDGGSMPATGRDGAGPDGTGPDTAGADRASADGASADRTSADGAGSGEAGAGGVVAGGARPYAVALVELAEGVRMVSNVIGVPYDRVRIGMPVRLEFTRADEELVLPVFRALRPGAG